jgi:carboxypeptidase C (cathepsin A)
VSLLVYITMLTFTKLTSAALSALLLMPASAVASLTSQQYLRQSGLTDITESSCNAITNKNSCYQQTDDATGTLCEWCVAGAIPSECMSQEQAKQLPTAVFQCSAPGFDFVEGKRHSLNVNDGDADFCDSSSTGKSGYMDIKGSDYDANGENKHLFFWMYEKRGEVADDTPFVVWLTGGPGCSSTLAFLTENGPCSVNKDGATTTVNPYSWTESAHVLWLDQPAGVGFSYGEETDSNEEMIGEDAYYFLQAFFQTYPEYADKPLFIVGESYGGHYAPAIAHRVWKGNQAEKEGTIQLKLSGIGIGMSRTKTLCSCNCIVSH